MESLYKYKLIRGVSLLIFPVLYLFSIQLNSQVLLDEDFTNHIDSITPPPGWLNVDSAGTGQVWRFDNPGNQTLNAPISDPAAILDSDWYGSGGSQDAILVSDAFDATNVNTVFLSFDHYFNDIGSSNYSVYAFNGSTWDTIVTSTAGTNDPQSESFDITSSVSGVSNARVAFRYEGSWGWYWILDNILVENIQCAPPTNLTASNITATDADIDWTENNSATDWEVEWDTAGFIQGTGTIDPVSSKPYNLSGLSDDTDYEFYVRSVCGAGDTSAWTGPFSFTTLETCSQPGNLSASNVTATDADLDWTEPGTATDWEIEWGTQGFTQGNGTVDPVSSKPFNLSGLSSNTAYEFYVRSVCGAGDTSVWVGPFSFSTMCPVVQAPFFESFEDTSATRTCWSNEFVSGTNEWTIGQGSSGGGITSAYGGDSNAVFTSSSGTQVSKFVSPVIDLSALNNPYLKFYYAQEQWFGDQNFLTLYYRESPSDPWVSIWADSTEKASWTEAEVLLPNPTSTYQIAFEGEDNWGRANVIDNITVDEVPPCLAPSNIASYIVNNDSAGITWNFSGSGTDFLYLNVPAGTPPSGTGTLVNSDSAVITGLSSMTDYDFYVREVCSGTDTSAWEGPFSYTSAFQCPPNAVCETYSVGDIDTDRDFTDIGDTSTCPQSVILNIPSGNWIDSVTTMYDMTAHGGAWMSEQRSWLYSPTSQSGEGSVVSGSVSSAGTETYMRNGLTFVTQDTGAVEIEMHAGRSYGGSGCGTSYIYVVDSTWTVIAYYSTANDTDAGVTAFVEPESFCGDANTLLSVVVQNFGLDTISGFDVTIDWTGAASGTATTTYTGSLAFGESDTVVVDTVNTFPGGVFNLTAYTQLTGDQNTDNDTLIESNVEFIPGQVPPSITSSANQSVCVGDSVLFEASGSEEVIWKDDAGNNLTINDSLWVYNVTGNDTFWAVQRESISGTVGLDTNESDGTFISQSTGWGLGFTAHSDVSIDSVTVYPADTGTIEILILDQTTNNVVYSGPVTNVSGPTSITMANAQPNVVPVGAQLPPGDYKMGMSSTGISTLIRELSIGGYPYTSTFGAIDITGGSTGMGAPTSNAYYWFYNWQITELGCESEPVMATVSADTLPDVDLGADTAYCEGDTPSFTFDAGAGASYLWSDSSTGQNLTADTAGVYWVEVTNANGCLGSDTIAVAEEISPDPDLGGGVAYCADDTAFGQILTPGVTADSYLWNDGSDSVALEVDTAGTYWVEVTTATGCVGSDTITVTENQLPVVDLGSDLEYCSNETFTANLDAGAHADVLFSWNTGDTGQTLMIDSADTYWVEITDTNTMCSYTDTIEVTEVPAPSVTVENDTVCDGEEATLEAGTGFDSYNWSTGESTSSINVTAQGEYFVTVTNDKGCEDSTSAMVEVLSLPVVDLGQDTALNEDEVAVLDAPGGMRTYNWNTGDTTESLEVQYGDVPNTFWVEVMNNDGCFGSDTIFIDQNVSAGAENLFNGDIKVYPNPVRNDANLEINLTKNGTLEIDVFSMSGQILKTKRVGGNAGDNFVPVEMNNLSKGMYMIRVRLDGERLGVFNIAKM